MSVEYDSFLAELDKELEVEKEISKVHYAKISYKKECEKRKKGVTTGIVLTVIFELLVIASVGYFAYFHDFHFRTIYEFENVLLGSVKRNSGTYTGATDFGYFDGVGTFNYATGTVYEGEWDDNAMSGSGTLTVPDLGEYVGAFSNGKKDGIGKFTWDDGTFYQGEWNEDKLNGDGEYHTKDGAVYKGSFKDNKLENGTCQFSNKTGKYKLEYADGLIKKAQISFKDGSYYEGDSDGLTISGTGKITYANGDSYEGEFLEGKRSGKGKYTWASGDSYEGVWLNDFCEGDGKYSFENGFVSAGTFKENRLFEGESSFVNEYGEYNATIVEGITKKIIVTLTDGTTIEGEGDINGNICKAKIVYPNGDTYDGEILNGMKHGKGTYKWSKGASYDGAWKNDVMSGKGTFLYTSDSYPKLVVTFKDGKPNGDGTYTTKNGKSYKTTWKDGKCTKVTE